MDVGIYDNPECGTSRVLGFIREAGIEPHVIEYLKTPTRAMLKNLIARMGISARELLREKRASYRELGLDDPALTEDQRDARAPDPDQPADRRRSSGCPALPPLGDNPRAAAVLGVKSGA